MVNQLWTLTQELFLFLLIVILFAMIISVFITIYDNIQRSRLMKMKVDELEELCNKIITEELEKEEKADKKN